MFLKIDWIKVDLIYYINFKYSKKKKIIEWESLQLMVSKDFMTEIEADI